MRDLKDMIVATATMAVILPVLCLVLYAVDVTFMNPPSAQARGRSEIQELSAEIRDLTAAVEANTRALERRR
jgi:ketosteroid isomerase-like protein